MQPPEPDALADHAGSDSGTVGGGGLPGSAARQFSSCVFKDLSYHARQTMVIRMMLPTTERLFWHCGDHTAKPESAL